VLARHIRRLPEGLEKEVAVLPDEIFAQVFGVDFAAMVAQAEAAASGGAEDAYLGAASSMAPGKSPEEVEAEAQADQRTREYCERVWQLPASERWSIESVWYNEPTAIARAAVDADPPPPALRSAMDRLREQCGSDVKFAASAQLLLKYAANAVAEPTSERFRTVKYSAKAFTRLLAPYPAAVECLEALGFARKEGASAPAAATAAPVCDGDVCTLPPASAAGSDSAGGGGTEYVISDEGLRQLPRLATHLRRELRAAELRRVWPAKLHPVLPDACRLLQPDLLQRLSDEVCTRHFFFLLEHTDNLARVESAIRAGPPVVEMLISQLMGIRQNLTAEAAASGSASASSASTSPAATGSRAATASPAKGARDAFPPEAGVSRVREIGSMEEWYDLLMDDKVRAPAPHLTSRPLPPPLPTYHRPPHHSHPHLPPHYPPRWRSVMAYLYNL
jgi:hypothetical protein